MLYSLISLMACLATGYICRHARIIDDNAIAALTDLLIKLALPCTIFVTMMRPFSMGLFTESMFVLAVSAAIHFFGLLLGILAAKLLRAAPGEKNTWIFAVMFANVGYMGYPVINAVLGDEALIYASMINIVFNALAFTFGSWLMDPSRRATKYDWRRAFVTPAMIATAVGIVFFVASIRLPSPVEDGVRYMANMTTPVSMLLLGAILAKSDPRGLFAGWKVYAVLAARHFVLPLSALAALKPFVHNHMVLSVIVLLSAMPAASVTAIFAQKYNSGAEEASRLVFISTVISLITVPVVTLFL